MIHTVDKPSMIPEMKAPDLAKGFDIGAPQTTELTFSHTTALPVFPIPPHAVSYCAKKGIDHSNNNPPVRAEKPSRFTDNVLAVGDVI